MPEAKSRASTSPTLRPRVAASSAAPAPTTPPPITSTSRGSRGHLAAARRRGPPGRAGVARVACPVVGCGRLFGHSTSTQSRVRVTAFCQPAYPSSRCSSRPLRLPPLVLVPVLPQLLGVLPEADGQPGGVRRAERRGLGDHRPADRDAEHVGLDLHAQVVGGHAAVDLEHLQLDPGVLLHRVGDVAALVADRLERGPGQVGVGVEPGQARRSRRARRSASTARTARRTPARSRRRRCRPPGGPGPRSAAAPLMMPSWSRSHCTADPVTAIDPSSA